MFNIHVERTAIISSVFSD